MVKDVVGIANGNEHLYRRWLGVSDESSDFSIDDSLRKYHQWRVGPKHNSSQTALKIWCTVNIDAQGRNA